MLIEVTFKGKPPIVKAVTARRHRELVERLLAAGPRGITKADWPGAHVGDYADKLRDTFGDGFIITTFEPNADGHGRHGRYTLGGKVKIMRRKIEVTL